MNVLVFGGNGFFGRAIVQAFRQAGHSVQTAGRSGCDHAIDFSTPLSAADVVPLLANIHIVVNAVGILFERKTGEFDAVHHQAVAALVHACQRCPEHPQVHAARIVHISAHGIHRVEGGYANSKRAGEAALANSRVDWAAIRPTLLAADHGPARAVFSALGKLPALGMPGFLAPGQCSVSPLALHDAAQAVLSVALHAKAHRRVIELAGPRCMSYSQWVDVHRQAALGTSAPRQWRWGMAWPLLFAAGWLFERFARWCLPASAKLAFGVDAVRMLKAGQISPQNETARWLGRTPMDGAPKPQAFQAEISARLPV